MLASILIVYLLSVVLYGAMNARALVLAQRSWRTQKEIPDWATATFAVAHIPRHCGPAFRAVQGKDIAVAFWSSVLPIVNCCLVLAVLAVLFAGAWMRMHRSLVVAIDGWLQRKRSI